MNWPDALDAVSIEIVRNALISAAVEMSIVLKRTAYNYIINKGQDFSVGLFNELGETLAQAPGLPEFVCDIPSAIHSIIDDIGAVERFEEGDIYLTNDPYAAQVGACRIGEQRYLEIVERFGISRLQSASQQILENGEHQAREAFARIPKGVYEAETCLDNDGVDLDRPLTVNAVVKVDEERITIDVSGSAAWCAGPLHANPLHRDLELVAHDVHLGLVSARQARLAYGVVIDEASNAVRFGGDQKTS